MFLRRQRFKPRTLMQCVAQIAWFFGVQAIVALPFTAFWSTSYLSLKMFDGNKTPLWAYLDIHGVFLFAIVSLLIWQTASILRRVYIRDFIGRTWPLITVAVVLLITAMATVFFV